MRRTTRLYLPGAAVALALGLLVGCTGPDTGKGPSTNPSKGGGTPGAKVGLRGGGSSFVKPMMDAWVAEYKKSTGAEVNYQAMGSTAGINAMIEKSLDFGATDAYLTGPQIKKAQEAQGGGDTLHVPLVMGGIVPAYNVEGVTEPINFTGAALADVYLGNIKKWSELGKIPGNENLKLPDKNIAVVARADGSGSTNIFTDYLCKVSPEFKDKIGQGTKVNWKVGSKEEGTSGVAGFIKGTANSLGYVELTYALQNKIQYGKVENDAKKMVRADIASVRAAAAAALKEKIPEDLRFSITNATGNDSYPLAGTTWAVIYVKQTPETAKALTDFFSWVIHDGQKLTEGLNYAALPPVLVEKIDAKLKTIQAH
jgi:phosphate transport system substrate-binding protein